MQMNQSVINPLQNNDSSSSSNLGDSTSGSALNSNKTRGMSKYYSGLMKNIFGSKRGDRNNNDADGSGSSSSAEAPASFDQNGMSVGESSSTPFPQKRSTTTVVSPTTPGAGVSSYHVRNNMNYLNMGATTNRRLSSNMKSGTGGPGMLGGTGSSSTNT